MGSAPAAIKASTSFTFPSWAAWNSRSSKFCHDSTVSSARRNCHRLMKMTQRSLYLAMVRKQRVGRRGLRLHILPGIDIRIDFAVGMRVVCLRSHRLGFCGQTDRLLRSLSRFHGRCRPKLLLSRCQLLPVLLGAFDLALLCFTWQQHQRQSQRRYCHEQGHAACTHCQRYSEQTRMTRGRLKRKLGNPSNGEPLKKSLSARASGSLAAPFGCG